jgi:hypothetical protein
MPKDVLQDRFPDLVTLWFSTACHSPKKGSNRTLVLTLAVSSNPPTILQNAKNVF